MMPVPYLTSSKLYVKCSLVEEPRVIATTLRQPSILFSKNSASENYILFCFSCIAVYKNGNFHL